MQIDVDKFFLDSESNKESIIIAGPCSAESYEQVLNTALELNKNSKISIFRAGLWKPRTRPGSFSGVGSKGLAWLEEVKRQTGLLTCTEVAKASQVQECLKAKVDILWIGARTTASPFAVQEIADALTNTDVSILIKNPVNPDASLWIGAIERMLIAGVKKIGIIHRGFSVLDSGLLRNKPIWQIVMQVKNYFPQVPIICDPSHIAGNKNLIYSIAKEALNYNINGLMIESHIDPEKALTDKAQQITPSYLSDILKKLNIDMANKEETSRC